MTSLPPPPIPRYGEASLADLLPALLSGLDVPGCADVLGVEPMRRVVLLVVDGLGCEGLLANARHAPFLAGLAQQGRPLTAGFPATTATSLASIGTGLAPGRHGLVGYTIALPGEQRAMNCLHWGAYGRGPSVDFRERHRPEQVQPEPTLFERAAADGVEVSVIGDGQHARSGLTRAVLRGGTYTGVHAMGDEAGVALQRLGRGRRSLVYVHHPGLDKTGHVRGVDSEMWRLELALVDKMTSAMADRLPRDAALVITGDHGMVDLRREHRLELADHPALAAGVRLLAGEARARHVHAVAGAGQDVLAAWQGELGERMWVAGRDQAIAEGWFGPEVADHVRPRIGDVVAAAATTIGVFQREVDSGQAGMSGHHGSMTPAEQLVPFLLARR